MSQIPEAAIRSAAEFVRDWAKHQRHTEGIGDCCHCNGNFLASWAENLLKDCSALEEQIQHTETNLQLSREHAEQMAAKLNDQEAELSRLEAQVEALQRENERLKAPVSDEEKRDYAMTATEIEIFMRIIASRAPQSTENGR